MTYRGGPVKVLVSKSSKRKRGLRKSNKLQHGPVRIIMQDGELTGYKQKQIQPYLEQLEQKARIEGDYAASQDLRRQSCREEPISLPSLSRNAGGPTEDSYPLSTKDPLKRS
jgi:hypothetical protein